MSLRRSRALLCVLALFALSAPLLSTATPAVAAGTGGAVTVTGNWHPWNPVDRIEHTDDGDIFHGASQDNLIPSVTVEQTKSLGDQVVRVSWRNFTPSSNLGQYGDADGRPNPLPVRLKDNKVFYGVTILQCRGATVTENPRRAVDEKHPKCYNALVLPDAPERDFGQNNGVPTVTRNDGTGSATFHVENATSNDLLRCSSTQQCSLVVIPNQGGVQSEGSTDTSGCGDHSQDLVQPPSYDQAETAATDQDFGACSWSKRIVVPLSFAPIAANCPAAGVGFTAVGSPALRRGLGQLLAGWCRGRGAVNFDYNFTSNEYLARSRFTAASSGGLTSSTDVALVTQPADPATAGSKRFVYAPIANDAVSIPYQIDNPRTGRPIDDLRLNARLVAKLLTQSYAAGAWNCSFLLYGKPTPWCAHTVEGNPLSIFDDKEFQALNFRGDHPNRASFPDENNNSVGDFFPTVVSGDSDMTYELTRWIAADAKARAFLQGRPDQYGTHVNKSYLPARGQPAGTTRYPTSAFQPLDPGWNAPKKRWVYDGTLPNDPRTYQGFQGSWNPISSLQQVATNLVGNRSTATQVQGNCYNAVGNPGCPDSATTDVLPVQFKKVPSLAFGLRDLTAVTDNTDAQSYRFPTAQLITRTGAAVAPTQRSMARAVATMKTNPDKVTQYVDHATVPGDAYPAMLPVYAMVPTCGVTKAKAAAISAMLRRVTTSQAYGLDPGTLTPGLLKLTSAQRKQTKAAAAAVSSQSCVTAPKDHTISGKPARNTGAVKGPGPASDRPFTQGGGDGGATTGGNAAPSSAPGGSATVTPSPKPTSPAAPGSAAARNAGYALDHDPGSMSLLLPLLLALGGAALLGSPLVWWFAGTPAGRHALNRLRPGR